MIVEVLTLVPSLMIVQLFRHTRPRGSTTMVSGLPWWCLYITYGLCLMLAGVSIFFIIVRGIEFGDEKVQQWLISILAGFFSSILLTQPLKVSDREVWLSSEPSAVLGGVSDCADDGDLSEDAIEI
jgi:hypothetical protein